MAQRASGTGPRRRVHVGVIGASRCDSRLARLAAEVGAGIAGHDAVLVCGGMGGAMAAACRGAHGAGGLTVGILPGRERRAANPHVDIVVASGMNEARNLAIIRTADVLIAVGGSYGTLSEIGFALRAGKRVIGLHTWDIRGIERAETVGAALKLAFGRRPAARRAT